MASIADNDSLIADRLVAVSARGSAASSRHAPKPEPALSARDLKEASSVLAETLVADAVSFALNVDGRSLRKLSRDTGLDPAFLSRLASGKNCTMGSLALLALLLDKNLRVSIE